MRNHREGVHQMRSDYGDTELGCGCAAIVYSLISHRHIALAPQVLSNSRSSHIVAYKLGSGHTLGYGVAVIACSGESSANKHIRTRYANCYHPACVNLRDSTNLKQPNVLNSHFSVDSPCSD